MSFLLVNNSKAELERLAGLLHGLRPDEKVFTTRNAEEALNISPSDFDAAFIDPELEPRKMNGIELAAKLKYYRKDTHIIFIARSEDYLRDAFSVHADAYLMNDFTEQDLSRELDYITFRYPAPLRTEGKLYIQTFGGFTVFLDGKAVHFERRKAQELLAILIDRRGAEVTVREACSMLFWGKPYDMNQNGYFHVLVNSLTKTLKKNGIDYILVKSKLHIAVNPDAVECDAYRFLKGDPAVMKQYRGDYMSCYPWTESASKLFS